MSESAALTTVKALLFHIGDDPSRVELKDTPARVVKSWKEIFAGYKMDPNEILKVFPVNGMKAGSDEVAVGERVVVKGIKFTSFCEHHLLPFSGTVRIEYVPSPTNGLRVGLSKLARLVHCFAKRLQVQERMTNQIAHALYESGLKPYSVYVKSEATHLCMSCRGVGSQASTVCTTTVQENVMVKFFDPFEEAEKLNAQKELEKQLKKTRVAE